MKILTISDDDKIYQQNDVLDHLLEIELSHDVVICTPNWTSTEFDVQFNGSGISLYNRNTMKYDKYSNFTFFPRMKMTIPNGLFPNIKCKIPGLYIIQEEYTSFDGIEIPSKQILVNNSNFTLAAIDMNYIYQHTSQYTLKEYNREIFIKYAMSKYTAVHIPPNQNVIDITFLKTFIGEYSDLFNQLYIIRSDYIYNNFPNLGGFK